MAPWTRCTRRWSCCSGATTCGPTCCSAAGTSRPCATRRTCGAWPCRPSIGTCRPSTGERRRPGPGPGPRPDPRGLGRVQQLPCLCRYYSGEKKAPVLTVFIGGNHEASNHLQELPYGGWVAPNIYYLGKVPPLQTRSHGDLPHSPCPARPLRDRPPVSRRLRGSGAVPRRADRRHLGHLQVSRLPERYRGSDRGDGQQGGEGRAGAAACCEGLAVLSPNRLLA